MGKMIAFHICRGLLNSKKVDINVEKGIQINIVAKKITTQGYGVLQD